MRHTHTILLLLAGGLSIAWAASMADEPAAGPKNEPSLLELDDPLEPLAAVRRRTDHDDDRLRALALFAAARVAEQKQDYPAALRQYERAFRFDPQAIAPLREIVPLAFNLDRQAEGVRYALLLAERDPADPMLLARLAGYLTEEGETDRALKLCEKAMALYQQGNVKPAASQVALWMEMGRLYFLAKKYDQTAHYFGEVYKALENPQQFGLDQAAQRGLLNKAEVAYQLFGESFLEAGKLSEAEAAFEKSNRIKADEPLSLYNRARIEHRQKKSDQALVHLQSYFDKHFATQGTGPYHLLDDVLGDLGQRDQLIGRLEKLHEADPDNIPLAFFLAQRYRQSGALDKAEPLYVALIEGHAKRPPLEAFQGLVEIYHEQKNAAKLLSTVGDAAARGNSLSPLGDAGKALLGDAPMCKAVVAAARDAIDHSAKISYGSLIAAGLLSIEQKEYGAANLFFERALKAENAKPAEALVTWGLELFIANQYADAAKVFQRGLDEKLLADTNPSLYFYLAGALEMDGRTDAALEQAHKAAALQPDSPRYQSRVAWIESHAKRYDAARKSYQTLLDRFEKQHDSPEVREVLREAKLSLSNICVMSNRSAESEEWIEQVLDEFPEDFGALNDLGYLWVDSGKHLELASSMIQAAVAHDPKNMAYRDSLGWLLFRQEKFGEAVVELKAAATAGAEEADATILDHLAEALLKNGDQAAAIASWNRAAEAYDKHSESDKARAIREKISKSQAGAAKP
jgi:tetratricopeptide (TPR) repeat protein